MIGGTLVASRADKLHPYYHQQLKLRRFSDVTITSADNDGLDILIRDLKPRLLLLGSDFYDYCTPFMMGRLHREFPDLNIAVVSLTKYPVDLGMSFIANGVTSFVYFLDGIEEFTKGLDDIRNGIQYISPLVEERMSNMDEQPRSAAELTDVQTEVARKLANGYTNEEIAKVLAVSERTVVYHKEEIYKSLNLRNEKEIIRFALKLKIIKDDELNFYGGNYQLRTKRNIKNKTNTGGRNAY